MKNRNERQKETRIIGGEPAASGNWPWIVSIRLREGAKHFCGGTVVKHRWVLSAAHCFEQINAKHIFLTAGHLSKNHGKAKNELGYQANLAEVVISHDNYNSKTVYADIALIKVSYKFLSVVTPVSKRLQTTGNLAIMSNQRVFPSVHLIPMILPFVPLLDGEQRMRTVKC